jgi:hypothetical protein
VTAFVALYVGQTINSARLIGVSASPGIVGVVAERLGKETDKASDDTEVMPFEQGRRRTLQLIQAGKAEDAGVYDDD